MITRAQIRRQLRKDGGIMNVTPRQGYFLGKVVKAITKPFKKVVDVGKQVIKSPIGKAAILGLGGAGLMGYGPMSNMLSGMGARVGGSGIGQFFKGMGPKLFGATTPGTGLAWTAQGPVKNMMTKTPGILGKLGLTKGGGSLMPTVLGGLTATGLMTYFMSKGKPEEEAIKLAEDVKRGEGLGLDLIKADIKKYRSGALSGSQMFDKGYNFLLPRDYIGAKGGRVGLSSGTMPTFAEGVEQMYMSDEGGVIPKKGNRGITKEDVGLKRKDFDSDENYKRYLRQTNKKAQGGRIGFGSGSPKDWDYDDRDIMEIMRDEYGTWDQHDADYYDNLSKLKKKKTEKKKKRVKAYGGGVMSAMPRIPMGMPRVNAGGVSEIDYRQEGGFVPVGVKEKADDVPAMLSKNEFVMTADAVKGAGGGNVEKGAQRMYDTMKSLEKRIA